MDMQQMLQQWQTQLQGQLQQFGQQAQASWAQHQQGMPDLGSWFKPAGAEHAEALMQLQAQYLKELREVLSSGFPAPGEAKPAHAIPDKRFAAEAWTAQPGYAQLAQLYLLNSRTLLAMADELQTDAKTKARVRFALEQAIAAANPANSLALNPEAQRAAIDSKGQSIAKGMQNLLADLKRGHMSQTDESRFEVGSNLATTPGAVVFENELFQLIEYKPTTATVYERPFLLIPPCINKYYILDLQPANSFVAHAVAQGHRTFVLSWRNPDESLAHATWDDYIENAAICAIETTAKLCKSEQINALGFCVGGTILATALAVQAARAPKGAQPRVASATFLTTLLDFSDTGVLDLFIDDNFVKYREAQFAKGGLLKGQELATTFSFLRPNDLVWNYVQGNYLKGQTPPPFDLLYWNSDSTNLPGPMYAWYLRNTYFENKLCKPKALKVCGEPVDFGAIQQPAYVYGSREDHIVPINAAFASLKHLGGPTRFVMGASGHIAGVINPPASGKRSHWIAKPVTPAKPRRKADAKVGSASTAPSDLSAWLAQAEEKPGSWWPDWAAWLAPHAGALVPAPKAFAAKAIEPAPGRYVKQRA